MNEIILFCKLFNENGLKNPKPHVQSSNSIRFLHKLVKSILRKKGNEDNKCFFRSLCVVMIALCKWDNKPIKLWLSPKFLLINLFVARWRVHSHLKSQISDPNSIQSMTCGCGSRYKAIHIVFAHAHNFLFTFIIDSERRKEKNGTQLLIPIQWYTPTVLKINFLKWILNKFLTVAFRNYTEIEWRCIVRVFFLSIHCQCCRMNHEAFVCIDTKYTVQYAIQVEIQFSYSNAFNCIWFPTFFRKIKWIKSADVTSFFFFFYGFFINFHRENPWFNLVSDSVISSQSKLTKAWNLCFFELIWLFPISQR